MILPVIITSFGRLDLLKQTMESLFKTHYYPIYPIVIDDGSTDGSREYLEKLEGIRLIKTLRRLGTGACRNFGVAIAPESEYLYFSDNDVYFLPNWDKVLIDTLNEVKKLGIVGGLHHPQHQNWERAKCTHGEVIISDQQAGYSLLIRRSLFKEIGPFIDGEIGKYGMEDTQLCEDCKKAGWQVGAVTPPMVVHRGLTSSEGTPSAGCEQFRTIAENYQGIIIR